MTFSWSRSPRDRKSSLQTLPHSPSPTPLPTPERPYSNSMAQQSAPLQAPDLTHHSYTYGQPAPFVQRNIGRDYLKSLSSSFANVQLGDGGREGPVDKPLPATPRDGMPAHSGLKLEDDLPYLQTQGYQTDRYRSPTVRQSAPPGPQQHFPQAGPSDWFTSAHSSITPTYDRHTYGYTPPPPVPPRPYSVVTPTRVWSEVLYEADLPPRTVHHTPSNPMSQLQHPVLTPPQRSFRASSSLKPPTPPYIQRPYSDPTIPTLTLTTSPKKSHRKPKQTVIDFTHDSSESATPNITKRSPVRRRRVQSEQPQSTPIPIKQIYPDSPSSTAMKCSGYTRKGQPCQRLVKVEAPYLSLMERNGDSGESRQERVGGRYCKDHAGMICGAEGFYWRGKGGGEKEGIWVEFGDYIPSDLGIQTQALLRMTMESPLTEKESPGFLYAYELRDLQTERASFFKIGRTDNVPRRIGEWTTRCSSHTPTLRDIFPLSANPDSHPDNTTSYLPGAVRHSYQPLTSPASKRWERLVHLELADRASQTAKKEYDGLKERCTECKAVHREIFPLARGERVYEDVVRECICRWERFIARICNGCRRCKCEKT